MSTTRVKDNPVGDNTSDPKDAELQNQISDKNKDNPEEQSTSTGITKSHSANETGKERSESLSSLDELAERLLRTKAELIGDESFITVEDCTKDITTSTEPAIIFSVNERTQNIVMARDGPSNYPPPPPYDAQSSPRYQGQVGQTPVYQERYVGHPPSGPRDASRAPPYRRNEDVHDEVTDAFNSKEIRNKFIQKVYMILALQLLVTFSFIGLCIFEEHVKMFVLTNRVVFYVSIGTYIVTVIILFCYEDTRRIVPVNFILLALVTLSMSYMTAGISILYDTYIVLVTFGVSAGICLLVSMVACQTWFDVTQCGMVLCLGTFIIMIYGIIAMFVTLLTQSNITFLIYACLMTLLFCMYLMYDTQQILGGRRIELSPEEYILGALTLYIDFMMIYENLLYIFGALTGN